MHEVFLAEKIINTISIEAQEKKAEKVLEARVAIPENEHFTPETFEGILKMQAEGTMLERAKFYVFREKIDKTYIKDIKIK